MITKIKLGDINIDTRLRVRDIDSHKVAVYRDVIKAKGIFPALVVDQGNTLIEGHHRYEAMMKEYKIDREIAIDKRTFKNDKERLVCAGTENQKQGFRLTGFEEKRLAFRLATVDADIDEISKAIGRPVSKIMSWHGEAIIVMDGKEQTEKPRKGGIPKTIKEMSSEQYEEMAQKASGWTPMFHADQIIHHIENKTMAYDDVTVAKLKELVNVIQAALKESVK